MNAMAILHEYGPQAVAALGGVAGVAKGGAWVVQRAVESRRAKREADTSWREEVREGIRSCTHAMTGLEKQVAVMASRLEAHDQRTLATAEVVQETREEMANLRGAVEARMARAENDAAVARHVASEANALATNAHHRLDTVTPHRKAG